MTVIQKIESEALVLHVRSYKETSALITLLLPFQGKISAVARGIQRPKSLLRGLLQPFQRLWVEVAVSQQGMGTLYQANLLERIALDSHKSCASGLYLNELLYKLLPEHDAHPALFEGYLHTLRALSQASFEVELRYFEAFLLKELGYAIDYQKDGMQNRILPNIYYQYFPSQGVFLEAKGPQQGILGETLIALATKTLSALQAKEAKKFLRLALGVHLHQNPLLSRQFFVGESLG